jgi:uncharacterized protein
MDGLLGYLIIFVTFIIGGLVKGVVGIGLPTVVIGVLSLVMSPAQAASLQVVPTLVTNVWQAGVGGGLVALLRRLWPMWLGICVGAWQGTGLLTGSADRATTALGAALVVYALLGLSARRFSVPSRAEPWLSPVVGALTGLMTAATGVYVIPSVPYLQALQLQKDDLVQALGLSFTVSTLALTASLAHEGALQMSLAWGSLLALAPALGGMFLGQLLRAWVRPEVFQFCFFLGLLALGGHLAMRALI